MAPPPEWYVAARERAVKSRRAQGLPDTVTDPTALARVVRWLLAGPTDGAQDNGPATYGAAVHPDAIATSEVRRAG